ncbi:TPA: hypothetical protein GX533_01740 [Candidatus Dojkabacteria bacterium]|jgi:hypothetical protein|uniref:Uncharacterized protein n=1 Tax=Candidatus Dojkabacteria bacterium TaxID=2099670 RepID=A0A832QDX8_9BACT|nr:hypothetical protein [Candidatus Dojkabacteria bacterium]
MEKTEIEQKRRKSERINEIDQKISSTLVLLKTGTLKEDYHLIIDIRSQYLSLLIPRTLTKKHISRLSEIIYEGFQTFELNPSDLGTKIPLNSVLKTGEDIPLIDALDLGIETANRLEQEMFLITHEGEESFVIPTGLKGGVDRENTDSDTLILIDAIDKGLKVHRYLPESE